MFTAPVRPSLFRDGRCGVRHLHGYGCQTKRQLVDFISTVGTDISGRAIASIGLVMASPPEFAAKRRADPREVGERLPRVLALTRRRAGDIHAVMTLDSGRDIEDVPVANAADRP